MDNELDEPWIMTVKGPGMVNFPDVPTSEVRQPKSHNGQTLNQVSQLSKNINLNLAAML